MKRFIISQELRDKIKEYGTLNQIESKINFRIRNIYYKNYSIRWDHLSQLKKILDISSLKLEEIKFDHIKNLGKYGGKIQNVNFPEKSGDLAEFIGIMLGDGSIYKNSVRVSFDKRHKDYIQYVFDLFSSIFGLKVKKYASKTSNSFNLYAYNKSLTEILLALGLKRGNKKKNQIGIPKWIKDNKEYSKRCIKGLIDTDGCIYFCKREKRKYIKFTNFNKKLMDDFKEITKNLGYSFAKSTQTSTVLYRKKEVVKFIKEIKPLKSIMGL